jgi:translation initiation factor 5B
VKNDYVHHKRIKAAMGLKISAPGMEEAMAGTTLHVCNEDTELDAVVEDVRAEYEQVVKGFNRKPEGVYVMASTLGSLEALMSFLKDSEVPVWQVKEENLFSKREECI